MDDNAPPPSPTIQLYLGSASPRRRELLEQVGLRFHVLAAHVPEERDGDENARVFVARVAAAKSRAVAALVRTRGYPERPVLGADTCVLVDTRVFGKPRDETDANTMLRQLSGRTHEVITAIALAHRGELWQACSHSRVTFKTLTDGEINAYWNSGEPSDKAGAYAIQGLGSGFVCRLEGSYSGVVGLPLFELRQLLQHVGIDWL